MATRENGIQASPSGPSSHLNTTRRLALYIPNTHPRAMSPVPSPITNGKARQQLPADLQTTSGITQPTSKTKNNAQASQASETEPAISDERSSLTSAESSRDFLARERTYFSWLRLSSFLCIASIALFLRLRLRVFVSDCPPNEDEDDDIRNVTLALSDTSRRYAAALSKKALRKHLLYQSKLYATSASSAVSSQIVMAASSSSDEVINVTSRKDILDTDPALSKALGVVFFALAVVALIIGHVDYMRCIRALQDADRLCSSQEPEEGLQNRMKWHDASSAKKAHSSRVVHIVEIVIALAIFATALIILSSSQGNIS
ncbi:hypothetical protein CBS101457_002561 [Exobasidium rhododendri]|nr:hypothetical protein CBS101457_002561 [Exobasidium rhododendri]